MSGGPRVRVHWMPVGPVPPATVALLDEDSRQQAAAITHPAARQRFLAGRVLTLTALATTLGVAPRDVPAVVRRCEHCRGPHGRPRIPGSGVSFNLTRSGDLVAVATVGDESAAVGLDLERRSAPEAVAPEAVAAEAVVRLRSWTRKEALLKATGHGLVVPMEAVTVSEAGPTRCGTVSRQYGRRGAGPVGIVDVDLPGHVGAVAVLGAESIRCVIDPFSVDRPSARMPREEETDGAIGPYAARALPSPPAPTSQP